MLHSGRSHFIWAAVFLAGSLSVTSHAVTADHLRIVALTGTQVPDALSDARFTGFENRVNPAINNSGQTAFQAFINESGINKAAVLTEGGGNGLRVAASEELPVTTGFPLLHVLQALNDRGQTAYLAKVPPYLTVGLPLDLIRDNGPGDSEVVARWATAEETGFGFRELFPFYASASGNGVSLNDAGHAVFPARASDSGLSGQPYVGVWRENPAGGLNRVIRVGDPAPGASGNFAWVGAPPLVTVNRSGQIAFSASTTTGIQGIWSEYAAGLTLRVRAGDPVPGTGGATIGGFDTAPALEFNSRYHLAFAARLTGAGVNGNNNSALWRIRNSGLELVAREGDQAIGTTPGQIYWDFSAQALNARGDVAFIADTRGPDGTQKFGLWSDGDGNVLKLLAYPGISAPGAGPGAVFDSLSVAFPSSSLNTPLALNANGQVAFAGSITGPGVDDSNNSGIWAQDRAGRLRLIARRGDQLNVSGDLLHPDFRTISGLLVSGTSGNDDGRRSWFNNQGQLAFFATFTDGSRGLFVSNLAAVPEPASLSFLLIFLAAGPLRRR